MYDLTVSVDQELGMGSLCSLQGCSEVSARAASSSGDLAGESLVLWLLATFSSLLLEDS